MTNNGKTAIARRFLARHTNAEDPDAERSRIETALVQAPNGPSIPQLLRSILTALGREPGPRPTSARLRAEVHGAMRDVGLRLLLIDDLHNIRGSRIGGMLVELREIGSITGVSIGAFATKEIAHVFRLDEQLANRFALLTLPRWQFDDLEYAQLLATFERHLPLRRPSDLTGADLARHILTMAGGLIGGIAMILSQAATAAIEFRPRTDRPVGARWADHLVARTDRGRRHGSGPLTWQTPSWTTRHAIGCGLISRAGCRPLIPPRGGASSIC